MPKPKAHQDDEPAWQRYRQQPVKCKICGNKFRPGTDRPPNAVTCSPACGEEREERWWQKYYEANRKHCKAPALPGSDRPFCDKPFTCTGRGLVCSHDCGVRRRWALQRERYHADPQAKRDYKNAHYAANYAQPVGTTRCPNPACGREYLKRRRNQDTCGRPVCHLWKYGITHREEINARKRKKRRGNPAYAAYQRDYRGKNPEKFKGYRPKINERQQRQRAAKREAEIAAGTFVDHRRKLTDSQKAKIVKQRLAGKTLKQIAESFRIHFATVARICDTR